MKVRFPFFRIRKITLTDFRNIKHGEVDLPNGDLDSFVDDNPSVLGLYGQNGSGKTSLLMAIDILEGVLTGSKIDYENYASAIREGCEKCKLSFEFVGYTDNDDKFEVWYDFCVKKTLRDPEEKHGAFTNSVGEDYLSEDAADVEVESQLSNDNSREYLIITDEHIQYSAISSDGEVHRKQTLIDTSDEACVKSKHAFGNKAKYELFTAGAPDDFAIDDWFNKQRIIAEDRSTSFIFSQKVLNNLLAGSKHMSHVLILKGLSLFGASALFCIDSETTGINNMKGLPLMIRTEKKGEIHVMMSVLQLVGGCEVRESAYQETINALNNLNNVLSKLIPGLQLLCIDRGIYRDSKNIERHKFEIISDRNGVRIPFLYESDGIRRIVSFLSLLIAVYNNPTVTLVIDEIDSGIFEYLLGEILTIMGKNARGQLIFTSHNLRPLEVLPPKYLMFTSVNPNKRFVKLEGISGNNNLRDVYFRNIVLGSGKEAIYEATDTYDIERALYAASNHDDYDKDESEEDS